MNESETPIVLDSELERALNNLIVAAGTFVLAAQRVQRERQPDVTETVAQALAQGAHFGVKIEIGDRPSCEAAVVHGGTWFQLVRWPAPQVQPIPNAMVN